jgi:hypothetical protein
LKAIFLAVPGPGGKLRVAQLILSLMGLRVVFCQLILWVNVFLLEVANSVHKVKGVAVTISVAFDDAEDVIGVRSLAVCC